MAKLPTADDRAINIPQASSGVVGYNVDTSASGAMGRAVSQLGDTIQVESERWDKNAAENAFTKIRQGQIDLAAGENGYLKVTGEQAVKGELHKKTLDGYDKMVEGISSGLGNDRQRDLLMKRADIARTQVSEGVLSHVIQQEEVFFKDSITGRIQTEHNNARLNAFKPAEVALSLGIVTEAVNDAAERYNWPADKTKAELTKQTSDVHETVISALIEKGHDLDAQAYYDKIKDGLSADSDERIAPKLKAATTDGKASRAVDEIWGQHGPTSGNDPVRIFSMEQAAREKFKDDPSAQKAAIGEIRSRAAGFNAEQTEVKASNVSQVMDAFNNGMPLLQIKKSAEFQALPGDEQTRIIEHITDRGYTISQRAKADEDKAASPDAQAIYWGILNSTQIDTMSDNQVLALQPHIGANLVDSLMKERARPDRVSAIALDNQVVKDVYGEITGKTDFKSKKDQAALARLSIAAKNRIDQQQRDTNKKLTFEEKQKIVQQEADRKVMKETWFGMGTEEIPLISAKKTDKVIVPIDQIPQEQVSGLINIMRGRGKIESWVTDDAAKVKFKSNLQKAYGRYQAGGSQQEVMQELDR